MSKKIAMILATLTLLSSIQMGVVYADTTKTDSDNKTEYNVSESEVQDSKEPISISVDDAIKITIENSQAYKDLDTSIDELRDARRGTKNAKDKYIEALNATDEEIASKYDLQLLQGQIMGDYVDAIRQKNGYYVKKMDISIENLENAKKQMEAGLGIGTRGAYYGVLTAEKTVELNQINLNKATEQKRVADVKYANGLATKIDVLSANIALQQAKTNLNTSEDELNLAKLTLLNNMGVDYDTEVILTEKTLEYVPTNDINLDDAINKALTDRAEVKKANNDLILQEMDTHAITAYYTSGNTKYKVAEKKLESAKLNVLTVNKNIELDIRNKYLNLVKMERELLNLDKSIELLQEAVRVQQVLLDNGMASPVDVINAQADLTNAQIGRFKMLSGYTIQKIAFENSNIINN